MKKNYLLICLLAFNVLFSQEWLPINNSSNGIVIEGGASPAPLVVENSSYHDTKGQLDVSSSGEVNFNFPIAIPP